MYRFFIVSILFSGLFINSILSAKCYSFRKIESIKVCIEGDSNADRRKAQDVCKDVLGADCGGVAGYTGSCAKSEKLKCYNKDAKEQKHITVD
ncbi:MAG TPA: hypothetical protein PK079_14310 [Leptospiraceae bacterium]|nr:hypothetical protein [Leptospiraceae bacterium]HMX32723.1 hypothetical protein [Leptospiraceae bacterium]HMY30184.1 hypothetical protein [Leptospiraceae bacterium]HMZ65167.1 hypothetical protein [Leptospiraceae bacterium]HNA06567.1 hypothetical protein [Leptospiraceae bacterium]